MDNPEFQSKEEAFQKAQNDCGKTIFQCRICKRQLATKQTVLNHLHTIHHMSPVKKVKKLYVEDPSLPMPKATFYRHSAKKKTLDFTHGTEPGSLETRADLQVEETKITDLEGTKTPDIEESEKTLVTDCNEQKHDEIEKHFPENLDINYDFVDAGYSFNVHNTECFNTADNNLTDSDNFESENESDLSLKSDTCSSSETDSESCSSDINDNSGTCEQSIPPSSEKINTMCFLSCITRHKLTETCANDILKLMRIVSPNSDRIILPESFKDMLKSISDSNFQEYHYCSICEEIFPQDKDIYKCQTPQCTGFRYKGNENDQISPSRQSSCKFILTDIESQLKALLSNPTIWKDIEKTKETIRNTASQFSEASFEIHDVIDGEYYRNLCKEGQFLADPYAISGIFNTDGIPLYSSTKEKLWPIFLAVNEINIERRFLRENMILAGIWQGKKNPPFFQYLATFSESISKLYYDGFHFKDVHVKFDVILGSVDLQAKSYILNMTMHNGAYGCITCEEPGETVRSGRGYARHYPYREKDERNQTRTHADFVSKSLDATKQKRNLGICGPSGLIALPSFDLIVGTVPDYMHCVLLGICKSLLLKFFSPTNSGKPYFIGKSLLDISRRLKSIKPPDYLERLPRDLYANYQCLKASELQAWLLFYSLPCLRGYLPDKYLQHLAKLSEGIYICLSDSISNHDLERAHSLLNSFYKDFGDLYGKESCGLNVHNVGAHICFYVKQWGPLYGWSCFGFEDGNAELLSFAHGTGDVTHQLIRGKNVRLKIDSSNMAYQTETEAGKYLKKMSKRYTRKWVGTRLATNCRIAGSATDIILPSHSTVVFLLEHCGSNDIDHLKEIHRVEVNGERFYSKRYQKMKRRICHIALCEDGKIVDIEFFILNRLTEVVYFYGQTIDVSEVPYVYEDLPLHILQVNLTEDTCIRPVNILKEKMFFIQIENHCYICRVPNKHIAVLK